MTQKHDVASLMAENEYFIPAYMHEGMNGYVNEGVPPGSFLRSVLENDFRGAVCRADGVNKLQLSGFASWLLDLKPEIWGCHGNVDAWIALKGEERVKNKPGT